MRIDAKLITKILLQEVYSNPQSFVRRALLNRSMNLDVPDVKFHVWNRGFSIKKIIFIHEISNAVRSYTINGLMIVGWVE